jgi:hypothetical protein
MWLLYDTETGAQIGELVAEEPVPGAGEAMVLVPGSAIGGATVWNPAARAFRDVPLVDGPTLLRLLTPAEIAAAVAAPAVYPVILQFLLLIAGGQPQRVTSPLHQAGAAALLAAGILTEPRHAEFAAGLLPNPGGN